MTIDQINKESAEKIAKEFPVKRTPRNYDSILKGALALDLKERVALKKELQTSIESEVKDLKEAAENAVNLSKE